MLYYVCCQTFVIALVSFPVIFLQTLAAKALDAGGNSLITVFNPNIGNLYISVKRNAVSNFSPFLTEKNCEML